MRQLFKDIWISRRIFTMLFIGFLLTILPLLIALSTTQYYDEHFSHMKNGVFKYNYALDLTEIQGIDFTELRRMAEDTFHNSSVITNDLSSLLSNFLNVEIVGLLNHKLWSPSILKGSGIESINEREIVVGKLISTELGSTTMWDENYNIKGIAGHDAGEELINVYNFKLFINLNELPESIERDIKQNNHLRIMVRSDQNPTEEIEQFILNVKQHDSATEIAFKNITKELNREKNSREGVNEILRFPKMLTIIGFINGINMSHMWLFLKRKELSIRKAIGASNLSLLKHTWLQLLVCAVLATIGASILQLVLSQISLLIVETTSYYVNFNTMHLVIGFVAALGISCLTSIVPLLQLFRAESAIAIKE